MGDMQPQSAPPTPPTWGLVIVRVAAGLTLVQAGWGRIADGAGTWVIESTAGRIASSPDYFKWWGQEVLLRWPALFSTLACWSGFLLGAALLLGILTRPVGWASAFLLANVYFAGPADQQPYVLLLAACALACSVGRAGRRIGFDELLDSRLPVWLTWVRG